MCVYGGEILGKERNFNGKKGKLLSDSLSSGERMRSSMHAERLALAGN